MPEEEHTFNQKPADSSTGSGNSYPQADQSPKDDNFSNTPQSGLSDTADTTFPRSKPSPHSINHSAHQSQTFAEFNQSGGSSPFPAILVWICFVAVLVLTGFFWLSDYSNVKAISEKESEKNSVVSQLNSADNKKTETEANNFKSSFQQLSSLVSGKISKSDFLNQLYTHLTRDIKVNSISLSGENEIGIDGATGSYRQVADMMLGLKGFDKLTEVSLKNVSVSTEEGIPVNQKIVFSVTAKVNFETGAESASVTTGTSSTTP